MPKLKLKSGVKKVIGIFLICVIFLSITIFSTVKINKQRKYEKTYEYKLLDKGYSELDTKTLQEKLKNKELDYILKNDKDDIYLTLLKEKYFIYDKFYDYLEYYKNNLGTSTSIVVQKVNTNTNKPYYTDSIKTDTSKKELMLVNKYYYLDETYEPESLVSVPLTYAYGDYGSVKVTEDTYNAFLNLWKSANEVGYYLIINSAYRTFENQSQVYNDYKDKNGSEYADKIAARPGYSEHQTGYSFDIFEKGYTSKNFQESESYDWLIKNAHKYGFIQRYPKDKEDITGYSFESWHFRYVGVEAATTIYENDLTFDEYYAYYVE